MHVANVFNVSETMDGFALRSYGTCHVCFDGVGHQGFEAHQVASVICWTILVCDGSGSVIGRRSRNTSNQNVLDLLGVVVSSG